MYSNGRHPLYDPRQEHVSSSHVNRNKQGVTEYAQTSSVCQRGVVVQHIPSYEGSH